MAIRTTNAIRSENGQSLVEFAFSASVLVSFLFVFVELCLAFYSYAMIGDAARRGSRYAIVRGSTCVTAASKSCTASASDINTYVSGFNLPNIAGAKINATTTFPDGNEAPGSRVKVSVSYQFPISLPFVPRKAVSLSNASEMTIIQ